MNLLIVDDEYYTVESISNKIRTLRPDFFEIFCAYNLTQALEAFSAHPIDLMICDIEMPGGSGLELLDQIRQHLEDGMTPYHAVVESAVLRFRPIMLTSFAEVLGMIPLLPNPFWSPMSAAFIGGLSVATPLGLLFVPALYSFWYKVKEPEDIVEEFEERAEEKRERKAEKEKDKEARKKAKK